jgi:hypothetical protein
MQGFLYYKAVSWGAWDGWSLVVQRKDGSLGLVSLLAVIHNVKVRIADEGQVIVLLSYTSSMRKHSDRERKIDVEILTDLRVTAPRTWKSVLQPTFLILEKWK